MAKIIVAKKAFFLSLKILLLTVLFGLVALLSYWVFFQGKDRVNLLFLGEAGPGYDGSTLTDTIILTSIGKSGSVMVSIPRDIWWVEAKSKVNSLYSTGGFPKAEESFSQMLGVPVNGSILIDFTVFERIVDQFGGIKVEVDATFDDFLYPIPGKENDLCDGDKTFACRYEHLHFDAGMQLMNGETALKYARSRHAEGDEGTDYARSRRQQIVIAAIKNRILSRSFLLNPGRIIGLAQIVRDSVRNDITKEDLLSISKIIFESQARKVSTYVLDGWENVDGYLYHPAKHESGLWVLLPQEDDWGGIHQFIQSIL